MDDAAKPMPTWRDTGLQRCWPRAKRDAAPVQDRLQALQARVEPAFLFDVLEAVRAAYARDIEQGEALLHELTSYLRQSLPSLLDRAATLEGECERFASYVKLSPAGREGGISLAIDVTPGAAQAAFPHGALLRLLQGFVSVHAGPLVLDAALRPVTAAAAPARDLVVGLQIRRGRAPVPVDDVSVTLKEIFGDHAKLSMTCEHGIDRIEMRLPCESRHA